MKSRIDFIAGRVEANLEQSGTDEHGEGVVELRWKEWPADAAQDPTTGALSGDSSVYAEKIPAFLHFVNATAAVRQFAEIQIGDCIIDISPKVDLQTSCRGLARMDLRYVINGVEYQNKPIGEKLSAHWDAAQNGRKLFQTVLLRRST